MEKEKKAKDIEIKQIRVKCHGVNHERIWWHFSPYDIFKIIKNITKTEMELAIMAGAPEEAIQSALKVIDRKYRTKQNVILSWKERGFTKTQETYIRSLRANQMFKNIDSEGNLLLNNKTSIKFDKMKDMTPRIKSKCFRPEETEKK